MSHTYFVFEPDKDSITLDYLPRADEMPPWTYAHDATQRSWYVRDTKQNRWLTMVDAGVPENYRLELLLLQATQL